MICTRDRPRLLRDTIDSILEGEAVPDEILVVDQSAVPAALDDAGARGCEVRILATPPRGLGQARNDGADAARHAVIVFVDDDMLAHPAWFRTLVGALVDAEPKTVVTGAVEATEPERWRGFAPATQRHAEGEVFSGRLQRDVLAGGHMAIERSALEDVGGFDPRFGSGARYPAADDNDLGFRLLEAGYRIAYIADAVLYHRSWRPGWGHPLVRWRYGRGKGGFYTKHRRVGDGHMRGRARHDIGGRLRRFPRRLLRHPALAAGDLTYTAGIVAGAVEWRLRERD